MTTRECQLDEAARRLYAARETSSPIPPLTETYADLVVAQAYSVQRRNLARHLGAGARLLGHKIGLTSAPMQALLGVNEPDFGYVLDTMLLADGAAVPRRAFCTPRVEPEVAFLLRAPLCGPGVTVTQVMAATEAMAAALEIVDSPIADWRITLADTVADNASSGAVVVGEWVPISDAPPLPGTTAALRVNDALVETGQGTAVMGDPAAAVAWLTNALSEYGTAIEAGQFVMSGSYTTAAFVEAGDRASATITGLGTVALSFA
ncbi:2-keto-4-pentenoate hydratase [Mycobacterium shigaense]|uniref:2-keto-4-pentenoate hydratase n=1 Tax=Mycobacterium shigaense TaxID=722731 RepID=UPI00358F412C